MSIGIMVTRNGIRRTEHIQPGQLPELPPGFVVLHERRLPGRSATIDHIIVGPTGVFLVQSKHCGGKVELRSGELFLAGYRRTELAVQADRLAQNLKASLGAEFEGFGAEPIPVLMLSGTKGPRRACDVHGTWIVGERELIRMLTRTPAVLSATQIERLSDALRSHLPNA